jgi:phenylalanyl-tRNA synthetase alpha chain
MLEALNQLESQGLAALGAASDADALEKWRQEYLGNSGKVKAALAGLKDVPKEAKPAVGAKANQVRVVLEEAFKAKQGSLGGGGGAGQKQASGPLIDMTEPGLHYAGAR